MSNENYDSAIVVPRERSFETYSFCTPFLFYFRADAQ